MIIQLDPLIQGSLFIRNYVTIKLGFFIVKSAQINA